MRTSPAPPGARGRVALGLDGCPAGWFAVCLDERGRLRGSGVFTEARAALDAFRPSAVAVDMPVGLTAGGARDADAAARRVLAGAASSVFGAPPRAVLDAFRAGDLGPDDHGAASALCRRLSGKGLTQQSWRLVPKIAEIDVLAAEPASGATLLEVHPEVSFRLLAGRPLPRKRSWDGLMLRRRLLAGAGVALPDSTTGGDSAPADDVIDAAVAAWTAVALVTGAPLRSLPAEPRQHDGGRPIAIWARVTGGVGG